MSYQVLARKYRPQRFSEVIGQDHVTRTLKNAIEQQRIATATGQPARDRYRIMILDEAHQITDAAFNALLKTLEEPPPWVVFMMATTQPEDIPQTIRSRCQHFSFHAVKFDEIIGQLRAISNKEGIEAGDEALAVLAEAGDGSMRDALSIMDQAIACCGTKLSAALVLGLVGSVGSEILEDLMGTVARSSSEEALRLLDRLMTEGQNPAHFAKQLVRFLRNALVAKVGGADSAVLQISSDERKRVRRVAEQFSEEDLARFLQIMLRTYDELGYRQEQRFHLELGVLKMVHAQRLLPLEQILSQVSIDKPAAEKTAASPATRPAAAPPPSSRPAASTTASPFARSSETPASPFETDRARKSRSYDPEMSAAEMPAATMQSQAATATAVAIEEPPPAPTGDPGIILGAVLAALEQEGHNSPLRELEKGSAIVQGSELIVTLGLKQA